MTALPSGWRLSQAAADATATAALARGHEVHLRDELDGTFLLLVGPVPTVVAEVDAHGAVHPALRVHRYVSPTKASEAARLEAVSRWSLLAHEAGSPLDRWVMDTARALLADEFPPVPPPPLTLAAAFTRVEIMRGILDGTLEPPGPAR